MMEYQWEEYVEELRKVRRTLLLSMLCHLRYAGIQSDVREVRAFNGYAAVFCNDQLIGGTDSFLQWAAYNFDFNDRL